MNPHGNRTRLAGVLAAVAAALALVALPGLAAADHGHDGLADAGTVESFDQETGMLTIALTEGGAVSGLVTPRTHIHCDNGRHRGRHGLRHRLRHRLRHGRATASHDRGGESEDNHRNGEEEPGDDNGEDDALAGEDNHEAGDDSPGDDGTAAGRGEGPGRGAERSDSCSTEDLTEGATVKFAVLMLVDGKAIFKVVGLPKPAPEGEPEAPPGE